MRDECYLASRGSQDLGQPRIGGSRGRVGIVREIAAAWESDGVANGTHAHELPSQRTLYVISSVPTSGLESTQRPPQSTQSPLRAHSEST
jgi:hypothetical protein